MRSAATPLPRADDTTPGPVRVCLLSAGADGISGGHRYHQHLLAAAPDAGFSIRVARPGMLPELPPADVVVIDSLYAWRLVGAVRRRPSAACRRHRAPAPWRVRRLGLVTLPPSSARPRHLPGLRPRGHARAARCERARRRVRTRFEPGRSHRARLRPPPGRTASRRCGPGAASDCSTSPTGCPTRGSSSCSMPSLRFRVTTPPCISWVAPTSSPDTPPSSGADADDPTSSIEWSSTGHSTPRRSPPCTRPPMRSRSRAESRRTAAQLVRRWPPDCRSSGGAPPICAPWWTTRSRDYSWHLGRSASSRVRSTASPSTPPTGTRWPKAPGDVAPAYLPGARRPADSSMSSPG